MTSTPSQSSPVASGERLKGYWKCTNQAECTNIERSEREVMCWKCGKGEMVYVVPVTPRERTKGEAQ